jgi:hypothetical protein
MEAFLVFSLTNIGTAYTLSPSRIFPEDVLMEFKMRNIKFNAIPKTAMKKMVQTWIDKLGAPKNTQFLESIVEKADGNFIEFCGVTICMFR